MKRKLIVFSVLVSLMTMSGCANMNDTQKRMATGAAIGGASAGIISGKWGWAAVGAAAGATGGYLYDQSKKNEQKAYQKGVKDGQAKKSK
ncbi:MAG: hypothetical protein AB7U29_05240 [Desulfobulbus sp.]